MTIANLEALYDLADADDRAEGLLAYSRYNQVMRWFAEHYDTPFERVVAAFVALSPNSDYFGNLRSLASVLRGVGQGLGDDDITVSTYGHCKRRACAYVRGDVAFLDTVKGPKIRAFYANIVDPLDKLPVTIDGHMHNAWRGTTATMRNALVGSMSNYRRIVADFHVLADSLSIVPNQLQATIWFARKRTGGIVYAPQLDMFYDVNDKWRTLIRPIDAPAYEQR